MNFFKSRIFLYCGFAIIPLLGGGCSTGHWEEVSYVSPSSRSLPAVNPKVQVVAIGKKKSELNKFLVNSLKTRLNKDGKTTVVDKDPEFIISIDSFVEGRKDSEAEKKFNTVYVMSQKEQKNAKGEVVRGHDVLRTINKQGTSAVMITAVTLYDVRNLEPIGYFTVTAYDSDFVTDNKKCRTPEELEKKLSQQILKKLTEIFVSGKKPLKTYIPKNVNKYLWQKLVSGKSTEVMRDIEQKLGEASLARIKKDIKKGIFNDKNDQENALSLYYLYLLAKEQNDASAKNLKHLYQEHCKLISMTSNDGLITACANTLGRIRRKWQNVSKEKIDAKGGRNNE